MYFLSLLALIVVIAEASGAGTCPPEVACLSSNTAAASYCTVMLEAFSYLSPSPVSTVTKTVTNGAQGQVTVTSTTIESVTITEGPTTTIYTVSTIDTTTDAVVTTYTSAAAKAKRDNCNTSADLSSLSALASKELSTACSCLDAVPTPSTLASGKVVTVSVTLAEQATVTSVLTGEVKVTVVPSDVVSFTVTSSFTKTSTVTLAAPTFTRVFGPEAGCQDLNARESKALNASVVEAEAISICQDTCAQNPICSFVYVQYSFDGWSPGVPPFYQCYLNNHTFVEADVNCGQEVIIWGNATGYNAIGRGV